LFFAGRRRSEIRYAKQQVEIAVLTERKRDAVAAFKQIGSDPHLCEIPL
jgi:hypothetical protein